MMTFAIAGRFICTMAVHSDPRPVGGPDLCPNSWYKFFGVYICFTEACLHVTLCYYACFFLFVQYRMQVTDWNDSSAIYDL